MNNISKQNHSVAKKKKQQNEMKKKTERPQE